MWSVKTPMWIWIAFLQGLMIFTTSRISTIPFNWIYCAFQTWMLNVQQNPNWFLWWKFENRIHHETSLTGAQYSACELKLPIVINMLQANCVFLFKSYRNKWNVTGYKGIVVGEKNLPDFEEFFFWNHHI
jgi:hypothetical protein